MSSPTADPASISPFTRLMITGSVMLASSLQALDMTIANVALPHMQGELSASQDQIAWVLTSYIVAIAVGIPLAGWLADRFGRRIVLLWTVAGFCFASMACGVAETLPQIIVARALQGALGAGLMPLPQAVIMDIYPSKLIGRGLAIYSAGVILSPIIGPTLGGLITDTIGWRWVFYMNLPIGLLAFIGLFTYLPKSPPNPDKRLDYFGFATLSLSVGLLQAILDRGQHLDWFSSTEIRMEAAAALIAFSFFVTHTLTTRNGSFFNVQLLKNSNYVIGLVGFSIAGGIITASRALFPSLLQGIYLYSAFDTGIALSPAGIGAFLAVLGCARWADRMDGRVVCAAGFLMMAYSLWLMTGYNLTLEFADIAWPNFIQGVGLIIVTVPLMTIAFSTLSPVLRNEGSSIYSLARNIGGSAAISITQAVLVRNSGTMHATLAQHVTPYTPYAVQPYSPLNLQENLGLALMNEEVTRQAAMVAYLDTFTLMMLICLLAAPLLLLLKKPKRAAGRVEMVLE